MSTVALEMLGDIRNGLPNATVCAQPAAHAAWLCCGDHRLYVGRVAEAVSSSSSALALRASIARR